MNLKKLQHTNPDIWSYFMGWR